MHNLLLREISDLGTSRVKYADTGQLWFEGGHIFSQLLCSYATWDYYNLAVDTGVDV